MPSLYEIINRAAQIAAGRISGTEKSLLNESEMTLEALYEHSLRYVFARRIKSNENISDLMRRHEIEFTDNIGELPPNVVVGAMKYSVMPDRKRSSFVAPADFGQARFASLVDFFTVEGTEIKYKRAGVALYNASENFLFVTTPLKDYTPLGYTKEIDVAASVVDDVILTMAGALTGEISLAVLMENQIY